MYGMGLVVLSQMVQAVQLTFEDYFLADLRMAPLQVSPHVHTHTPTSAHVKSLQGLNACAMCRWSALRGCTACC